MCKYLTLLIVFAFTNVIPEAAERKDILTVDASQLTAECQVDLAELDTEFGLAWWIPVEFWEFALSGQDMGGNQGTTETILALRPYFIVAIVQADITAFGSFNFYPRDSMASGLQISYVNAGGETINLQPLENPGNDIGLLVESMKPILRASMGNMGQSFRFFIFSDRGNRGERIVDPYTHGELQIRLGSRRGSTLEASIECPLNALFVPRLCPNGKQAHVSWDYCPWTGQELTD